MATLYLTEQQTLVKKEGDTLLIHIPENKEKQTPKQKVRIPLIKVDRVVVQGNSTLTSPAISALMQQRTEITFLNQYGRFQGHLTPSFSKNGQLRLAQTTAYHDPQLRHHLSQQFIIGKLTNMRTMLQRANRKHKNDQIKTATEKIKTAITVVQNTPPDPTLPDSQTPQENSAYGRILGQEGSASAYYFNCFPHLLTNPDLFNGRTRRPPRDPANALLSYGYTILLNQILSAIGTVGLDPYIGYLHRSKYGKPALALDLMEEFRPLIVDSTVLTLFNNNILNEKSFIETFGTYRLTNNARKTFLQRLEARFDEKVTHPTFGYKATYRRCLELQTRLLAKTLQGELDSYPPFKTR